MTQRSRQGMSRSHIVLGICGAAFLVLLLVVNPIGDALSARGVPNGVIGVLLTVVVIVLLAVPIATLSRARSQRNTEVVTSGKATVESWAQAAGWRPATWQGGHPAVIDRIRLRSSELVTVASGAVSGYGSVLSLWQQSFSNRASPVTATTVWLVLTVDGMPPAAQIGLGRIEGTVVLSKSPIRWAGGPPISLMRSMPTHPWGFTKVALWPGIGVPPPPAWAEVAAELDAMHGWLLVHGSRLGIAVRLDREATPPERLTALANRVIGLLGGFA